MKTERIQIKNFYVNKLTPHSEVKGYVLFVHGGPGNHCAYFEEFIKSSPAYKESSLGWLVYDQRGCGRSQGFQDDELTHAHNVKDLKFIVDELKKDHHSPKAVLGHSYGAWVLYDCLLDYNLSLPPILVGMASSILLPKNRSLMMDLQILKQSQPEDYNEVLSEIDSYADNLWKMAKFVREKMQHPDLRKNYYWGNLEAMRDFDLLKSRVPLEENEKTFRRVRATLYADESSLKGPFREKLGEKYLWINGFHDYLMGGEFLDIDQKGIQTFYQSGHYPQIEEPLKFVNVLERFIQ